MRRGRLRAMGITELAVRGRQEASKWWERIHARAGTGHLDGVSRLLDDRVLEAGPDRFFEGAVSADTPGLLCDRMAEACARAIARADAACRGQFDLLGYCGLFFGDPVDWHLDPVSGRRAPRVHWSRLDPLDPAAVGDSKVVWELNRHQWLVHLGQAYRLTGDERYAAAFARFIREWMRANPRGIGLNWASSLEVALRLISWCWALFLFRGSAALSRDLFAAMVGGIRAHASHVERYLSYYFSPNTHLTGEALGLFYAGVLFPELRSAGRWSELGARILVEQSERQVLPDGVYFEESTCYQRYAVEIYLHFLILAARNGVPVSTAVSARVQRMLDFLLAVRWPDGSIPQIGDADGGWLVPLAPRAPDDFRGVFSTAAAFFGRPDYAWAAGVLAPETVWLLDPAALKAFEALQPAPPATAHSRLFPDGGYAVMRSGWEARAHQLIFDVGPLGDPVSGGHGHADLLSIQCAVFGEPCLVDAGTFSYTADRRWRDFFRSTAAHSTVTVDGQEQAVPAGPFAWEERPRARLLQWLSTEAFDFADAEHDAYSRLQDPVRHRRRVLFVKPRYWVLVDDLEGAAEHLVELRFQFVQVDVGVDPSLWARAQGARGWGLFIRPFAPVALKADVREGELAPIQGWVSLDYGQRLPAPVLIYSTVTRLPLRIATLLFPVEHPLAAPPAVSPLVSEGRWPVGLAFGDRQESIRFDDRGFAVTNWSEPGHEGGT
ncbi:MAG: alginate lyase family protein [Candidatus Rokubacteria bacterium]|nr:alginate lyase family protein [Candidatus Rokubacteria bacterium]